MSSKGLTVDEMLKKYPKKNVERAIFNRDYVDERNRLINTYKDIIAKGGSNVETAAKALNNLLKDTPPEPPIDLDEPADLDQDVLWRIKALKYLYRDVPVVRPETILDLDTPSIDPDSAVNHDAILDAYRRGNLKVVPGEVTVWFAGNLVIGPLPKSKLREEDIINKIPEWRKKYGPGRTWQDLPEGFARSIFPAIDENWTHIFSIKARLIGETEFIIIDNILDDTGSDYLELFLHDDCVQLGLTLDYEHWGDDIELEISSHENIKRHSIRLEVQLILHGASFGPVFPVTATISPGKGGDQERSSGMGFRRHLFTATSPYGDGDLHLSDVKTGATRPLRAKPK